jgi:DNA (cytosine-5)-methyltransferase 1
MFQDNLFRELVVDNFAGGGGASTGMELALGYPVDIAVNHDADAIAMHKVNHPYTRHFQEDVFAIDPERVTGGRAVGIAWFSPDCKHFSRAKGGKPVDKKIRGLSWVVLRWAMSSVAPRVIFMENVPEIKTWCPLIEIDGQMRPDPAREGETFNGFVSMLTGGIEKEHPAFSEACEFLKIEPDSEDGDRLAAGLGYAVAWKELKACDYGAPTIRNRFYLIARRDGQPIVFPEPTHGKGRKPYRTAAECIDWSLPCPSIFGRKKELAENTLRRIARGLDKFVIKNPKPFIMQMNFENAPQDVNKPLSTQTAVNKHYVAVPKVQPYIMSNAAGEPLPIVTTGNRNFLCAPSLVQYHSEQGKGEVRGQEANKPIMTIDGSPRYAMSACYPTKYFGGERQAGASLSEPTPTVTAIDHSALAAANLLHYYGGADHASRVDNPLPTVTTLPRHYVVKTYLQKIDTAQDFGNWANVREILNKYAGYSIATDEILIMEIDGERYFISDIGMRMLKARELMLAQGFPSDYIIDIESHIGKRYSEAKQIARMGNAVCPPVAEALVRANCAEIASQRVIATMAMLNAVIDESCQRKRQYRRAAQ